MSTEPAEPRPEAATDAALMAREVPAITPTAAPAAEAGAVPAKAPELSPAACGARLASLFPALFVAPGAPGPVKPIKLRIHADIHARTPGEFSKRVLGIFFSRYTTTNAYLKALTAPGAQRFDLDGQPAGDIADEHRAAAVEELARRHAIAAERRTAQRPLSREAVAPPDDGAAPLPRRDDRAGAPRATQQVRRAPQADGSRREPRDAPARPDARDRAAARPGARPPRPARRDDPPRQPPAEPTSVAALPADPAQRERAVLLRAFEASPLSKANFCALMRISEAELDAALTQALEERR